MITITIDGKTYQVSKDFGNHIRSSLHHDSVDFKELKPLSQKRAEAIERGREVTILEKLREELDKYYECADTNIQADRVVRQMITELRDLLTSLEQTKEEPVVTFNNPTCWSKETKVVSILERQMD